MLPLTVKQSLGSTIDSSCLYHFEMLVGVVSMQFSVYTHFLLISGMLFMCYASQFHITTVTYPRQLKRTGLHLAHLWGRGAGVKAS